MCCASRSAGSKAISPAASPTASCRRPRRPARRCSRSLTWRPLPAVTFVGALLMLAEADPRLMVPLLVWLAYLALMRWTIRRAGPASTASSDARSAVTGRVVDSYTNIHSVKLFAHQDGELTYAKEAIETARQTFQGNADRHQDGRRADLLNGLMILGVTGWRCGCGCRARPRSGVVAAATGAGAAAELDDLLDHVGVDQPGAGTWAWWPRGWRPSPSPSRLVDRPGAKPLDFREGPDRAEGCQPPLRPRLRRAARRQS
jgi:ATP-binding cassette subfamily B multidrug efflux pump